MTTHRKKILEKAQIQQIIRRMAYEIYEQNFESEKIFLAGIDDNGVKISELLAEELKNISEIQVLQLRVDIDKDAESQPVIHVSEEPDVDDFTLIIVDDVLNSGRTMVYSLDPFLKMKVRKIQTAVLVNRTHLRFPVEVNYKGFELSTTIEEHIHVQLKDGDYSAYLY